MANEPDYLGKIFIFASQEEWASDRDAARLTTNIRLDYSPYLKEIRKELKDHGTADVLLRFHAFSKGVASGE